jgi:hypothetical protein
MARFIVLTILGFIVLTFLSTAIKGVLRRMIGNRTPSAPETKSSPRIVYQKGDVTVMDGNDSSSA